MQQQEQTALEILREILRDIARRNNVSIARYGRHVQCDIRGELITKANILIHQADTQGAPGQ
jgi:hypothetical protein